MARARSPNRDKAFEIWRSSKGKAKLKDIADQLGTSDNQIRKWKNQDKWDDQLKGNVTNRKSNVTNGKNNELSSQKKEVIEKLDDADLTEKQRLFCLYYIKSFNATLSAIKAGYSPHTAHSQGPRLLENVGVKTEIKRLKGNMTQDIFIDAMDVLQKYITIAFADITDYLTFGKKEIIVDSMPKMMNYVDFNESEMIDGSIISEVKQGKDGVSIKLEDRMKALDKLSLYFDLFPDRFKRQIEEEKLKLAQQKEEKGDGNTTIEIHVSGSRDEEED